MKRLFTERQGQLLPRLAQAWTRPLNLFATSDALQRLFPSFAIAGRKLARASGPKSVEFRGLPHRQGRLRSESGSYQAAPRSSQPARSESFQRVGAHPT
jgi:hypothetical protein